VYIHSDNISATNQNAKDVLKEHQAYKDLIKVYEYVENSIILTRREQKGIRARIASLYFWLGYSMIINEENNQMGFSYLRKGLKQNPLNPYFWKSYIACLVRRRIAAFR